MNENKKSQIGLIVGPSVFLSAQQGVLAQQKFKRDDLIFKVEGPITTERTIYTFPLSKNEHIDPRTPQGEPTLGHYLNHSCNPNAQINIIHTDSDAYLEVLAKRDIQVGEEITIDYALMEYEVAANDKDCLCCTAECRKKIMGYKDLSAKQKSEYKKVCIIPNYLLEIDEFGAK